MVRRYRSDLPTSELRTRQPSLNGRSKSDPLEAPNAQRFKTGPFRSFKLSFSRLYGENDTSELFTWNTSNDLNDSSHRQLELKKVGTFVKASMQTMKKSLSFGNTIKTEDDWSSDGSNESASTSEHKPTKSKGRGRSRGAWRSIKRTLSLGTNKVIKRRRKIRKSVSFDEEPPKVYPGPRLCDYKLHELRACWFRESELRRTADKVYKILADKKGKKYCFRGLEGLTERGLRAKIDFRQNAYSRVLEIQYEQYLEGRFDPQEIAEEYTNISKRCLPRAIGLAEADEIVAARYLKRGTQK